MSKTKNEAKRFYVVILLLVLPLSIMPRGLYGGETDNKSEEESSSKDSDTESETENISAKGSAQAL